MNKWKGLNFTLKRTNRHATVLIWSGKLFQSEGTMTEKVQFP